MRLEIRRISDIPKTVGIRQHSNSDVNSVTSLVEVVVSKAVIVMDNGCNW